MIHDIFIHQIFLSDDKNPGPVPNKDSISEFFSGRKNRIWSSGHISSFMSRNRDTRILSAFNTIKPYALKADIARYYIVYKLGGWYTDVNNYFVSSPPDTKDTDIIVFRDAGDKANSSQIGTWSVQNSIFYSKPNNPILEKVIDRCVKNVESKYYGHHPLFVTGPPLFGACMAENYDLISQKNIVGNFYGTAWTKSGFYFDENLFAKYKPYHNKDDIPVVGGNSYVSMWHNRELYP